MFVDLINKSLYIRTVDVNCAHGKGKYCWMQYTHSIFYPSQQCGIDHYMKIKSLMP